jgi:rSAM/selenodomain-associated transferase 2
VERISIIMPTLNEAGGLRSVLVALPLTEHEELVVVDGGSSDHTMGIAGEFARLVIAGERGRALQMNRGAERSTGDILLFLHADTVPPPGAFARVREALRDERVVAGAFDLAVEHPAAWFRLIEWGANLRSRLTRVPYGDQGLFMRRTVFQRMGGFREMPLMEDIEMGCRLRRLGRIAFLRPPVRTHPRRWLAEGPLRTTLRDWSLALAYTVFGVRPERLARFYGDVR